MTTIEVLQQYHFFFLQGLYTNTMKALTLSKSTYTAPTLSHQTSNCNDDNIIFAKAVYKVLLLFIQPQR